MRVTVKRKIEKGQFYYECGRKSNTFKVLRVVGKYALTCGSKPSKVKLSRLADTRYYKLID